MRRAPNVGTYAPAKELHMFSTLTFTVILVTLATAWAVQKLAGMAAPIDEQRPTRI